MKKTVVLFAAFSGILFAACTKTSAPGPSAAEKMLTGKWRLTYSKSFTLLDGRVTSEVDVLANMDSCAQDDLMDLRDDRTYYTDQGDKKCFPFLPQDLIQGTWKLQNNETELVLGIDSPAQLTTNRILELSSSKLRLYRDYSSTDSSGTKAVKSLTIYEK